VLEERREERPKKRSALPPMPAAAPARAFASRPPAPALAKSAAQRQRSISDGDGGGGGAGSAEASVEVLLYASLRLGGPSEPARGTLSSVDRRATFVGSLQALGLAAPFDVLAVVEQEVYVAGEYVLTTALLSVAPGGDFHLALGVEQAIKLARNTRFEEVRSGDKVVATNELVHSIELEVVNNLDREVRCEVRERIPQPAPDAEVVVEEGQVTPAWDPYTQEERGSVLEGGRRWRLAVKAGASQRLVAQYRVKLYANNELVGGNRREA